MGQIPIYTSKEQPELAAPEVSLGSDLATSNALAGNVLDMVRHVARRKTEDDLASAVGADGAYQNWHKLFLDNAETGPFSGEADNEAEVVRGVDTAGTAGTYERYQAEAEAKFSELSEMLANDEQRALFRESAGEHMRLGGDRVAAFEAAAADQRRRLGFGTHAMTESQRAAGLILQGREVEAAKALEMSMAMVGQSMRGRSPEEQAAAELALSSGYHGEVFEGKLAEDTEAARLYLEENSASIDPDEFEKLQGKATAQIDKAAAAALLQSVYDPVRSLTEINDLIDNSDAADIQKIRTRQAAEDQREIELAELKAEEHQRIRASEDAVQSALAMYGEGISFADLPDEMIDQMTPAARLAARTVYTQQLAGERAPYNRELEAELQAQWLNALDGDAAGFLRHSITELNGAHDPARLAYWQQRKDELIAPDQETQAKQNKRKPWYRMAERMIQEVAPEDAHVRQDVIAYIDDWHESNPNRMMEPGGLRGVVETFVGTRAEEEIINGEIDDAGAQLLDEFDRTHESEPLSSENYQGGGIWISSLGDADPTDQPVADTEVSDHAEPPQPAPPIAGFEDEEPQTPDAHSDEALSSSFEALKNELEKMPRGLLGPAYDQMLGMMELAGELSPGADVRDMLAASSEMTEAVKAGDVERLAAGLAMMGAAFAGVFTPGSVGGAKRLTDEFGRLKRAHKSRGILKDDILKRWPEAKELETKTVNKRFEKKWKERQTKKDSRWGESTGDNKFHPPYDEAMPSYHIQLTEKQTFMRVVSKEKEGNPAGLWLIRKEDFDRVMNEPNPIGTLKETFALPDVPFASTEVTLPANTHLRVGIASAHAEWGKGGAVQFEILDELDDEWFEDAISLSGGRK